MIGGLDFDELSLWYIPRQKSPCFGGNQLITGGMKN
jgi:hypothetical protein